MPSNYAEFGKFSGSGSEVFAESVMSPLASCRLGIQNQNLLPFCGSLSTEITPPWASTNAFAIGNPSPEPRFFRESSFSTW